MLPLLQMLLLLVPAVNATLDLRQTSVAEIWKEESDEDSLFMTPHFAMLQLCW
jgi:hypothetical protein